MVTSRLDYCNNLLYSHPSKLFVRLQRVQNSAARLIHLPPRFTSSYPRLYDLHWLPVWYRITYKVLLITFKAIHSLAPTYISELINVKRQPLRSLRSSNSISLERPAIKSSTTLGDRSFTIAAPIEWNKLPTAKAFGPQWNICNFIYLFFTFIYM